MKFLARLLPLPALLLSSCEEPETTQAPRAESGSEQQAAPASPDDTGNQAEIDRLESEIENSTNLISDMEAFIMMERAKIDDDPDYDQSFMEEALADQNEQREIIKQARKQLEELTGSEK